MRLTVQTLWAFFRGRLEAHRAAEREAGASVVETVIIAAGFAALALVLVAGITALVTGKLGGISLD